MSMLNDIYYFYSKKTSKRGYQVIDKKILMKYVIAVALFFSVFLFSTKIINIYFEVARVVFLIMVIIWMRRIGKEMDLNLINYRNEQKPKLKTSLHSYLKWKL